MKKRLFSILLVLSVFLSIFSGCGKKVENTVAKTYLDLAEDFISEKDYDSAVEILQKGLDVTGDKDVTEMLEQAILLQVKNSTSGTNDNSESNNKENTLSPSPDAENTNTNTDNANVAPAQPSDDIAYLNSFLSIFAAQRFGSSDGAFSDQDLLSFAYLYCNLYEPDSIEIDNVGYPTEYAREVLPATYVDNLLLSFFNRTIVHPSDEQWIVENWAYYDSNNGNYRFVCASGEYNGYVAIVNNVSKNQDGLYDVQFTVYEINYDTYYNNGEIVDTYFSLSPEEASQHEDLVYSANGFATLGCHSSTDVGNYYVQSYRTWVNARPAPQFDNNTSIYTANGLLTVSETTIHMQNEGVLYVSIDYEGSVSWNCDSPIISMQWGEWDTTGTVPLYITGIQNGSTVLRISDKNYPNEYIEVNVTVSGLAAIDNSKASGILASLGMTEAEFRNSCTPLELSIASDKNIIVTDLRDYPSNYVGQHFTFVGIDSRLIPLDITSKGMTSDGYTYYERYPTSDWMCDILLFDYRDDVYSPTISEGDDIYAYVIFQGVQTISGTDYVCFELISMDKR